MSIGIGKIDLRQEKLTLGEAEWVGWVVVTPRVKWKVVSETLRGPHSVKMSNSQN